jgi:membrane-associated phospholipid phosphatase
MKTIVFSFTLFGLAAYPALSQELADDGCAPGEAQTSAQEPAVPQNQTPPDTQRSVIEVKPGTPAIKNKDLYEKNGYFHPFLRMPGMVLYDQGRIWRSPFHTAKSDIKWWLIFGGAEAALIATDQYTVKQLPNTNAQVRLGNYTSNLGAAYTLIPISAGFYFIGTAKSSGHFRETGLLAFETLIDTTIVETVIKAATDRARPLEGNGKGGFWDSSGSVWNASFPSGHAINTFALASVFAHEYSKTWWVKALAYGYAATVVGARLAARRHFPGDVVAGGAMGWFIGDYVYGRRHNTELDEKRPLAKKILDHVRIGGPAY